MSAPRDLKHAFDIIQRDLVEATEGTGLRVKVAVVDLWCGLEPNAQGRTSPKLRTRSTPQGTTPHRIQLAITLPSDGNNNENE